MLEYEVAICGISGNDDVLGRYESAKAVNSKLQKRLAGAEEVEKLFWTMVAGIWPKAAAYAACHNDTIVVVHGW